MRGSHTIALLLASLALASPQLARAQPPKPSAKDLQTASELVKKAIARSQAGDHAAAIEIYLQANSLAPNTLLLSNIGWEYQQDGSLDEALTYFCMYLDKDPNGTNAPYARAQAKIVQRKLGNKNIDDDTVCSTPAKAAGPGDTQSVAPREPPPEHEPPQPPKREMPKPDEERPSRTLMYSGLVTGGVGVIVTGIGIYYGLQAQSITNTLNDYSAKANEKGWPPDTRQLQHDGKLDAKLQVGFLVAGGALVIGGAVMALVGWPDAEHHSSRSETAIRVTPTSNGLAVFGKF